MTKSYSMSESQLQNVIQARYQQQSKVGHGIVGQDSVIKRVQELGYFERLEAVAMKIDAEQRASDMKLDIKGIVNLARLERIFNQEKNQNTLSHAEFLAVKQKLQSKYGQKPSEHQVKRMMNECRFSLEKLERSL